MDPHTDAAGGTGRRAAARRPARRGPARWAAPAGWAVGALPLLLLLYAAWHDGLGTDPIREATHRTGSGALQLLLASLAVTPLRRVSGWNWVIGARRPLGLAAFFYAVAHFAIYLLDQDFAWSYVVEDVAERPWVTVGFLALLGLVPLALTSTRAAIRRLGSRWQKLHRLVYLCAGLGVLHYFLLVKRDVTEPALYAAAFAALMALRLWRPRRAA